MIHIDELRDSLPAALKERTRLLGREGVDSDGDAFSIGCGRRFAAERTQRSNAAIEFANRLELPIVVYQGLSDRYPYASIQQRIDAR